MKKTSRQTDVETMGRYLEQFRTSCQGNEHPTKRIYYDIKNYQTIMACPACNAVFPRPMTPGEFRAVYANAQLSDD